MPKLENASWEISTLMSMVENGKILLPQFQRDFVWNKKKAAGLVDSILRNYSAGAITVWLTDEKLKYHKEIGGTEIAKRQSDGTTRLVPGSYNVLDGQQRITTLFACIRGEVVSKIDFKDMYIDLVANIEDELPIVVTKKDRDDRISDISSFRDRDESSFIAVHELCKASDDFIHGHKYWKKLGLYKGLLVGYAGQSGGYEFAIVIVSDALMDVATEIFTRINTGGKTLDIFEIMNAKTYDEGKAFELSAKYEDYEKNILRPMDYGQLDKKIVLQVSAVLPKGGAVLPKVEYGRKAILNIKKGDFIDNWGRVCDSIERTIDKFRTYDYYGISSSALLPYPELTIIPLAFFHNKVKKKDITPEQSNYLLEFFWRCVLSRRYADSTSRKIPLDIERIIQPIINGGIPEYKHTSWSVDSTIQFIKTHGRFGSNKKPPNSFACVLASMKPKDFDGSCEVFKSKQRSRDNSLNYHHVFPKNYLKQQGIDEDKNESVNHILNIAFVTQSANSVMGDRAPSKYMADFKKNLLAGTSMGEVMATHLIGDGTDDSLGDFGIWDDNFGTFIDERAKLLSKAIRDKVPYREGLDIVDK